MKQSDPSRNRQSDSALISVYRTQMQQSAEMPWLAALLLKRARRLQNRTSYFRRQLNGLPRRWRRRLQRAFATGIVGAAFLLALGPTPSIHAATITVDPGASGIVVDGYCSLVEAIHNANDTTTGQPYGDCDTGDPAGADTIVLTGNTYTYTITYGTDSALPDITSDITITGSGSTIERDGAAANFRLMKVNGGGNLTLNQVTLSGGDLNATGGGLYVNIGEATINNSTISGNSANNGGGVGVFPRGTLTINNSTISGNSAGAGGGISAAKFGDNNATGINVTINNSTISGNTAGDGGGIRVLARAYYALAQVAVMVNNSTISGNSAANGGGIHNYTYNYGGYPSQATITLNNSTITGNSAANGGGVYNRRVSGTADITLHRSLVSGNAASASGDELAALGGGNIYLADYNLLGDSSHTNAQAFSGATPGASDITATIDGTNPTHISDILDTTLANNGGPTLTHALVPVSPAVDEAPAAACAAAPIDGLDQTGATRAGGPGNGGNECDIGAVEYANPSYPTEISPTPGAAGLNGYDGCSLVEAIITANTDVPTGGCLDVGGADTIPLAGNTYTYTAAYGYFAALPDITSEVTIAGNDSTIERDGGAAGNFRIMRVTSSGNLTLNQTTLTGGDFGAAGGGLAIYSGDATLNNSTISGNSASNGGGIAVLNRGTLTINNSTVSGNSAGSGGGIWARKGGDNNPTGINVTVNNSTISSNSASYGGGIFSRAESYYADTLVAVTVNNSTISGNTAIQKGGGIFNFAYDYSGHPTQALVTLNNSTITGNSAANGGGVYTGRLSGTASTYLHRSLVSGNSAGTGDELASAGGGNIYLADYNLLGDSSHTNAEAFYYASPGASDITATSNGTNPTHLSDILVTTLANNGGPTLTHALVPVSPAVDEAPAAACAASPINGLDQTGATRAGGPGNGGNECDIGAVEYANPTYPTEIVPTPGAAGLNGYDGCSLVEAIITANTDVPTGGCLDVGGADTILLAGNTYSYTVRYDSIFLAALPVIRSEITIEGNNSTIERDSGAATNFRIMRVHVGGNLTLNQVTLTGGNAGFGSGGALSLQEGEVTVNDSTITGNTALMGGGLYVSSGGTLAINNSAISGNSASDNGGGLAAYKKDTTPTSVTVTVNDSTISGNSAQSGGGILSFARSLGSATLVTVTVNNSTISGNTATSGGGGVYNYAYEGIGPPQATITLNNSTLTGNSAAIGGGVYSLQYSGTANTYLHRSIVSGNSATVGDELVSAGGGNVYLADYNLLGDSSQTNAEAFSGASPGASDISATIDGTNPTHLSDILDTTLANNGGPTLTHALVPVSPAIDEAPAAACAASPINGLDQTGAPRAGGPGNGGDECDIGAVEYANPSYPTEIIPTPGAAGLNGYDGCSLVEAIITANTDVPTGGCLDVGGADTIALAGNTYTYTTDYDNASLTALPAIYSEITIEGNNSTIERDSGAATNFRIMRVVSGGNLTLNQVTLTGGNAGNNSGGGLFVNEGEATVNSSAITGNSAVDGGGLAVLLRGTLTLNESTISGNSASRNGGGLAAYKNFDASSIPITVTVNGSTISGNSAQSGGGLSSYARSLVSAAVVTVTINNSTISGNSATSGGGGIYNASEVEFGDPSQATIMLNNSTVTGNSAASGGGLYNLQYSGTANTYLHRSLVSGNKGTTSGDELASSGGGNIYLNDYNLLGYSDQTNADAFLGVTPGATDITATSDGTDPTPLASILNTTLADNGGDTLTHALVSDSPAIDVIAIDGSVCDPPNTTDQRGAPRANGAGAGGSACDIGAFEFASTPTAITLSNVTANSDSADPTLITLLLASLSALTLGFRRRFKRKTG